MNLPPIVPQPPQKPDPKNWFARIHRIIKWMMGTSLLLIGFIVAIVALTFAISLARPAIQYAFEHWLFR